MPRSSNVGLLIIDAHAMAYRAYYALQHQNLTHPATGQPTFAIFGFFRMLFKLLADYAPQNVAVVWDPPGGASFRNDMYDQYKANRKPMPDDLRHQIDEIKELLDKTGFPLLQIGGYEADDVMGSLAARFGKKMKVFLISGDKDCYQLLSKNVKMLRGAKGVTEFIEIDPDWVKQELGIDIKQVTDYMGLVGDSSDNIPGARGVGPKSAAKLLEEYKSLKNIYKNLGKIKPDGLRKKLEEHKENVFLSQELATIKIDVPEAEEIQADTLKTPDYLKDDILQLFRHEGYNAIYDDLKKARDKQKGKGQTDKKDEGKGRADSKSKSPGRKYELIADVESLEKAIAALKKAMGKTGPLAVDTETDHQEPMRARLVGISLCARMGTAYYIPWPPEDSEFAGQGPDQKKALPVLKKFLEDPALRIVGQNIKYDMIVLGNHGIQMPAPFFDTMIASYLCNPNVRRHNMDDMAMDLLQVDTIKYEDVVGSGRNKKTMDQIDPEQIRDYACEDADITLQLHAALLPQLKRKKLESVNADIELPLVPVLADMEREGVAIDRDYFKKLSADYEKKLSGIEKKIYKAVGYEFNINSTKELQKILFEDLNLPKGKKTKTGYSTDQSVLEDLKDAHPVVANLLEHRKYNKLKSTYVDALPELINQYTGRIHTSFNQTIAATGRLSSVDPNLQNIPIREDTGRAIRRGFVPRKGNVLLSLDYSQIELRIMAHYSGDAALIETFVKQGVDIHTRTAASLFKVKESEVDPDMRSQGKAVNFSIIYGVTEFGLARNLGISREEARLYIQRFFEQYPGVRTFMDETILFAEQKGFVQTLSGRQRQIPEITSSNRFRKEGAQRTAINTPIQGTSADIIKLAMIQIHKDFQKKKFESRMILQVHDELLFDVVPDEQEAVLAVAGKRMENAMQLKVPLLVEHSFGQNWDEAH
ncbi:MAG: DNA polymerase I [Leptospiraceae bacterium]|nr:DNA polymerase I [Leptospiraceae bacterium]